MSDKSTQHPAGGDRRNDIYRIRQLMNNGLLPREDRIGAYFETITDRVHVSHKVVDVIHRQLRRGDYAEQEREVLENYIDYLNDRIEMDLSELASQADFVNRTLAQTPLGGIAVNKPKDQDDAPEGEEGGDGDGDDDDENADSDADEATS